MSQQEFEATALPLGVLWILMTQSCGDCAHEKRKPRCVEQESGVCCKVNEAGEQQLVTNKNPGHVLCTSLGVTLLVLHEEIINVGDLAVCMCIYLMFYYQKTIFSWGEEGTCTARDVVNSLLCCSGLRKVLEASISRYWEVTAFCRLFPVSEA